jgi:hypothetical protein
MRNRCSCQSEGRHVFLGTIRSLMDRIRHASGLANPEPNPTFIISDCNYDSKVELATTFNDLRYARNIDDSLV